MIEALELRPRHGRAGKSTRGWPGGARRSLVRAGYCDRAMVIAGDGELGAPDAAPYDRVIVTAAAHTVPYAWVEQARTVGRTWRTVPREVQTVPAGMDGELGGTVP
ncbi:hypothetical protein [Actinomadura sp. 9N215]|uniref:hypothetical protein n=1 Tax=Actinomadura sp. 9N215 TaxID=3375150 RepID=UPI0037A02704